ncbi:MAG: hypothetical protein ACPG5B_06765 [Chitinophagales bacterium]
MATKIIQNGKSSIYGNTKTKNGEPKGTKQLVFNGCQQKRKFVEAVADYLKKKGKEDFTKAENAINEALDTFEVRPNTKAKRKTAECLRLNSFINQCKNYAKKLEKDTFANFLKNELEKWATK